MSRWPHDHLSGFAASGVKRREAKSITMAKSAATVEETPASATTETSSGGRSRSRSRSRKDTSKANAGEQKAAENPPAEASGDENRPQQRQQGEGGGRNKQNQGGRNRQQNQQGGGRRKKKRKKGGGAPAKPSIPAHHLPSEEDLEREAAELEKSRGTASYKSAEKAALHIDELQKMELEDLFKLAEKEELEEFHHLSRQELIYRIIKHRADAGGLILCEGTLEILPDGYGFLRSAEYSYLAGPDDVYVSPSQIRRSGVLPGMVISGALRAPKDSEKYFALLTIDKVNGRDPKLVHDISRFEALTPLHPEERFVLETTPEQVEMRVVDLVAPIGKGQRGLIVAPPRTGKTVLLQKMTHAIVTNSPDAKVMVLLIDERPEEVTDFKRNTPEAVEVVASTFDEQSSRHVQVTEMVIEKAKRAVEFGDDVVILLDSITRLARAYNNEMPHSGKIMTGGIDSGALQRPKKFFGAARAIEKGGSLTILGTALIDTGSKADEVIFEEFKGTGNSELHLDRKLVEKRVYPAIDISASGTRREELLLDPKELELVYRLRKVLSDMNVVEAMELVKGRLQKTKTNAEFLMTMNLG